MAEIEKEGLVGAVSTSYKEDDIPLPQEGMEPPNGPLPELI